MCASGPGSVEGRAWRTRHERRERLHKLIDLALAYRSVSRGELAQRLDRDPGRLYPESDNPKLDFVIALAEALEWSVGAVVDYIRYGEDDGEPPAIAGDYQTLDQQALAAHSKGEFDRMVDLARRMFVVAKTADEKARACRLEGNGWDVQARLSQGLAAFRRGLDIQGVSRTQRLALQVSVANIHYSLWDLTVAVGIAHVVLDAFEDNPPTSRTDRACQAYAFYLRGSALCRMLSAKPSDGKETAARAKRDLERGARLYTQLAREYDADHMAAIAHTCRGALIEVEVELGLRDPQAAVDEILETVGKLSGEAPWPEGDWLESYGWWCDFGANIALRHLSGRKLQQSVAVFNEKLLEIAQRFKNWRLLERAVSMQYALHERVADATGLDVPYTLDSEDLKLISGTIGRFPRFRRLGWDLIDNATIVAETKR